MPKVVYTVREFNREVQQLLESSYRKIWIQGEISNLAAPASGHFYFTLKDEGAQVRCALFRNRRLQFSSEIRNGLAVQIRGQVSLYEARGEFQIIVDFMEPAGEGELRIKLEQLKQKLDREGLFDSARKSQIPKMPQRIGVITSTTGAAIRDILITLQRRYPVADVLIYPVTVQGDLAKLQISNAISQANLAPICQALIVARGGGSLEDLWAFNEESVVRSIYASNIPVITGIGHEVDVTLSDLAADMRAATPTAAAESVSPDCADIVESLNVQHHRLRLSVNRVLQKQAQRLDLLNSRLHHPADRLLTLREHLKNATTRALFAWQRHRHQDEVLILQLVQQLDSASPYTRLQQDRVLLSSLSHQLERVCRDFISTPSRDLASLAIRLNSLSPTSTLNRGYSILRTQIDGQLITNSTRVRCGEALNAELAHGWLNCTVDQIGSGISFTVPSSKKTKIPHRRKRKI